MNKQISSIQNPLIKEIIRLQEKSRIRKRKELFIVEGFREITLAIKGDYQIKTMLYCGEIIQFDKVDNLVKSSHQNMEIIEIYKQVYQKISHRKTTEGILAIIKFKNLSLKNLYLSSNPLILVAEAAEKPGNIGALLRTADAAKLDAVILANPKTDLYNPNIIRSSVGCVFTNSIAMGSTTEIIEYLKENNISIYAGVLDEKSKAYDKIDFNLPSAIVVGTEASGLSEEWLVHATNKIIIPMEGEIDSLNVSVSAAIIIFEAKRQRKNNRIG